MNHVHDAAPDSAEHADMADLAPAVEQEAPSNADGLTILADAAGPPVTSDAEVDDPSALGVHPAAALFPMLTDDELERLAEDIAAHGLLTPIVIHEGMILDGRNRLRACALAGVEPRFVEWSGPGSVSAWVFGLNLHRRHLTPSQRAMLAARAVEMFTAEAAARMTRGRELDQTGKAREKAAELFDVGYGSVHRAHSVLAHAVPELVTAVDAGDVLVATAAKLATLPSSAQLEALRRKSLAERPKDTHAESAPRPQRGRRSPPPRVASPPPVPQDHPTTSSLATDTATVDGDESKATRGGNEPTASPHGNELTAHTDEDELPASADGDEPDEASILLPELRPDPQPLYMPAFKEGHRAGTCPKDEAAKVAQILETARSALYAWRWLVIEWNEDKRWDMKFALHQAGPIAIDLQHAVDRLEAIADMCSGRNPTPPPETP